MTKDIGDVLTKIAEILWLYYIPALIFFGTIGNVLCVLVPSRTEMKNMIARYYFIAFAISNEGRLIFMLVDWILQYQEAYWFHMDYCRVFWYIPLVLNFINKYVIAALIAERFIASSFPRLRARCTLRNTMVLLVALTILGFVLESHVMWTRDSNCRPHENWKNWQFGLSVASFIVIDVLPAIVIAVSSIRIAMTMRGPAATGKIFTHTTTSGADQVSVDQQNSSVAAAKETKVTKMLLIVAVVFLFVNLPSNLMNFSFLIESEKSPTFLRAFQLLFVLSSTSCGATFFVCCVVDQDFRRATVATIRCRPQIYSPVPQMISYSRGNPHGNAPPLTTSYGGRAMPQRAGAFEMQPNANAGMRAHSNDENPQK